LASSLIRPVVDPISGQPEGKHGVATIRPLVTRWQARLLLRDPRLASLDHTALAYWSCQRLPHSHGWWFAGGHEMNWREWGQRCFSREPELVMEDRARQRYRAAWLSGDRLDAVLLVEPCAQTMPDLDWLDSCFGKGELASEQRRSLLAAGTVEGEASGPIVCSCFGVGENQIAQAIEQGMASSEALGEQLKCGTNCGSCLPEIRDLLARTGAREPA
jgi:assimilatory nitrate reductase catalytic subunit